MTGMYKNERPVRFATCLGIGPDKLFLLSLLKIQSNDFRRQTLRKLARAHNSKCYKNALKKCQTALTYNLDELESPKYLELLRQSGYRKDPEFEAPKASLSHPGWDLITDCFATTYKNNDKEGLFDKITSEFKKIRLKLSSENQH